MAIPTKKPATYEDLRALPDHLIGELIAGELIASPRPSIPHARAASVLGEDLGGPFDRGRGGPGGWWFLFEPEIHLGADVLVPDMAAWRRERLPNLPDAPFMPIAPDWLCEVLSPGTRALDRVKKLHIYARERVAHVWLIDPAERTLEIFRLQQTHFILSDTFAGDASVRAEPFDQVPLQLGALWVTPTFSSP
ncbi:MAG TPA: Uma2 family endonuclease [Myxococcaceae bacterium]|nr:Uma2 family endonuclease [Myxococcaceae bacterium]